MIANNEILFQLLNLKPAGEKIYLVGGAVRDILLQKPGKDYDLVCSMDTRLVARRFADQQGGVFFMLDADRNTSRVILHNGDKTRVTFDFVRMQGSKIEDDLKLRDFSINAMAVDLEDPGQLIDPMAGAADLQKRVLRSCSPEAFQEDPVRVIRAVRYAVDLGMRIESETIDQLKTAVGHLSTISLERRRDEFLKIIDSAHPDLGLRLCDRLGILPALGFTQPGEEALAQVGCLHRLFCALENTGKSESSQELFTTSFLLRIGRFSSRLISYLNDPNPSGRVKRTLDLLASFLQHSTPGEHARALQQLSLSRDENEHLQKIYENQDRIDNWSEAPDRRRIFRFFQDAPVDLALIWLAGKMTVTPAERGQEDWLQSAETCERLVQAWAEEPELLDPKPILSGKDLMLELDMAPGPELGRLLDDLLEEQAAGTIKTKENALQWAEAHQESQNHW